jgi:PAP2 superfamily
MSRTKTTHAAALFLASALTAGVALAQGSPRLDALRGLAPVSALASSSAGQAALAANLAVTGAIQNGVSHQITLLPFALQQQQALRDAFITGANASELADGLGSRLGAIYQGGAYYTSADGGKTISFTNISPAIATLIGFTGATTGSDSNSGKYFFANGTTDGKAAVSSDASAIFSAIGGGPDFFGKAYRLPAGAKGANPFGNSRPYQTEPRLVTFSGKDFFGVPSHSALYLNGPAQDLTSSPSYPSGHTTYGYTESLLLALLAPERYPQMIARGAEYGNDRIILGAHYAMDVLGGRTLAAYDLAQLLANKPGYVGVKRGAFAIDDFQKALAAARADFTGAVKASCRASVAVCAAQDSSRFAQPARNRAFYATTQTYGLPVVFTKNARGTEDVGKLAPEAGYLLTAAFPSLTLDKADAILTATEGPGGGFLDDGSAFGVYSRLDLYRAGEQALALTSPPRPVAPQRRAARPGSAKGGAGVH